MSNLYENIFIPIRGKESELSLRLLYQDTSTPSKQSLVEAQCKYFLLVIRVLLCGASEALKSAYRKWRNPPVL
jgi:hypothetical protein